MEDLPTENAVAVPAKRWIVVPARAGSKGIPNKNMRLLSGKPLITYSLSTAAEVLAPENIILSTDSPSCAALADGMATVMWRSEELSGDSATLDDVVVDVARALLASGASPLDHLLTVQPTSPFLRPGTLLEAFRILETGAGSVVSVRDDRHLRWGLNDGHAVPLFEQRVNRQWLPPQYAETGGVIGSTLGAIAALGTRIKEPVALLELSDGESLDIDDFADWAVAEYLASRRRVIIRADGSRDLGMGHVYRAIALRTALAEHAVTIVARSDGDYSLGSNFLADAGVDLVRISGESEFAETLQAGPSDITILDVLDTSEEYVQSVREHSDFVVSIEDLGPGNRFADLVINDLYTDPYPLPNHWYGVEFSILGPQFEEMGPSPEPTDSVDNVIVTFGGSDPGNFTTLALDALSEVGYSGHVIVVLGPGYAHSAVDLSKYGLKGEVHSSVTNLAVLMYTAQLAITSAGRTVTELMTQGVPTIALCQNSRELLHTHASAPFGVVNLGLGQHVDKVTLAHHIDAMSSLPLRMAMRERMLRATSRRSNAHIAEMILNVYTESRQEARNDL